MSGEPLMPEAERFNKHIFFNSGSFTGNLTYTGLASWKLGGREIRLYDVIADSLSSSAKRSLELAPLVAELVSALTSRLNRRGLTFKGKLPFVELHLLARHPQVPHAFIGVLSTDRTSAPWLRDHELQWDYSIGSFKFYLAAVDGAEVILGGMTTAVRLPERERLRAAVSAGSDAFNTAKMCSKLIEVASTRSSAIGGRSVATVLPETGFLDTDLFDRQHDQLLAFMPRMVFANGQMWGPSEFPVDLSVLARGHLPKHSLFFKAVVNKTYKKRDRRRIFRSRKGKMIPGIMGLLMLTLYGKVPVGYADFDSSF